MSESNHCRFLFSWLLFLAIILLTGEVIGQEQCSCREDRVLELQSPYYRGKDIRDLQQRLKEMGYYHAVIDGIYGLLTAEAVGRFQQENQLKADGIMDQISWDLLGHLNCPLPANYTSPNPEGKLSILINLDQRTLTLYQNGQPFKIYPVAVGKGDHQSPVGEWLIRNKYKRSSGGMLGSRWLGLNVPWGIYGIHGTNKPWEIGTAASLGCIRMHNHHVEQLFEWLSLKVPVKIVGKRERVKIEQILRPGQQSKQVMELQLALRKEGFYRGNLDACYSNLTELAVKELETIYGLYPDGIADFNVLFILGLVDYLADL